ncbi:hypothetical protein CWI39_0564p0020 [Hamiltosporidium magnivora]|uniref:Uncharacterized protein n=1 Tax=Hamiltosporidium magnivora TaxID=148818 RepID=A0A4V2JW06_9MICR|nr:hypothetical protein CWI39_0564p0020 [Hamiltosporidium magnivora]
MNRKLFKIKPNTEIIIKVFLSKNNKNPPKHILIERKKSFRGEKLRNLKSNFVNKFGNIKKISNISNMEDIKSMKKIEDIKSISEIKNIKNMKRIENIKSIESIKNIEDIKNIKSIKSIKNIKNIKNVSLFKNLFVIYLYDWSYIGNIKDFYLPCGFMKNPKIKI